MALTATRRRTAIVFASLVLLGGTATGGVAAGGRDRPPLPTRAT
ncbi:hypothetical protein [Streptomyces sp. SM13]|nr:hypothetical protein [Streptomyces sp. SM13]